MMVLHQPFTQSWADTVLKLVCPELKFLSLRHAVSENFGLDLSFFCSPFEGLIEQLSESAAPADLLTMSKSRLSESAGVADLLTMSKKTAQRVSGCR